MTTFTEVPRAGAFLLSEGNGSISREKITVVAGDVMPAGQVLGKITASGKLTAYNNAATDGSEAAVGILYGPLEASTDDRIAVAIVRVAEVEEAALTGFDEAARADLAAWLVICR
ncbi:MAG: hypothetical protein BWY57_01613 [Betaproteobacteria bacterium ADurb.Bin341]|nr:MAG: hypothetical protein BWY57_01613 [Betaproteobacteria bacterium ADurb.Bin341]